MNHIPLMLWVVTSFGVVAAEAGEPELDRSYASLSLNIADAILRQPAGSERADEGAYERPTRGPNGRDPVAAVQLDTESRWNVIAHPYAWIPARFDLDVTVGGATANLDVGFKDIREYSDEIRAVFGRVEVWRDRDFGFFFDVMHLGIESKFDVRLRSGFKIGDASLDFEKNSVDLGMAYQVVNHSFGEEAAGDSGRLHVHLLGGVRYQTLDQKYSFPILPDLSSREEWFEPLIGARMSWQFPNGYRVGVIGDASGFGVGESSTITWNAAVSASKRVSENVAITIAYRALYTDFSSGSGADEFALEGIMHGPYIGLSYKF